VDALHVLADNNFGDTRTGSLAGPMGLFIIVLLAIGTVLLIRNMNARIRRLPDQFPEAAAGSGEYPAGPGRAPGPGRPAAGATGDGTEDRADPAAGER
jgi:hypothetical protein